MFRDILVRVFFLVFVAVLGWIAGRLLKIKTKGLSDLVIYVISPFFACHAIVDSSVGHSFFKYTFVAFAFSSVLGLCAYAIGRWLWKDCRANLFGFAGGDSNTGYFALPVALSLFDSQQIAVAIFMASGVVLYEFSVGYLIVAKGVMPARQSLRRFVRLPFLYAVLGAVIMKECGLTLDSTLSACLKDFRGAYSVLGMMVVGLTLSEFRRPEMDWLFSAMSLSWNIGVQPVVGYILFGWVLDVSQPTLAIIFLMLASPMAANEVAIASSLRVSPEIVAPVVMISTLLALVYVPLCLSSAVFAFQ